jgi:hypothetical protein
MEEKSRAILVLNIKLDNNRSEDLEVLEDDEPEEVAEKFCKKHKLPMHVKQVLVKNIEDNLDDFIEEELGNTTTLLSSVVSNIKASNQSVNSHNRSSSAKNYGELLYDKGLMMKKKVEHMVQMHKQTILENEMINTTFTPKINHYVGRTRNTSEKIGTHKRHLRLLEQSEICTFKPKINNRLKKDGKSRDKCIELYNNAKVIQQRKEEKSLKM